MTLGGGVLHALARSVPFPPIAIAQVLVRATPGAFDSFFIDRLGHWAARLAVVGTCAAFLLVAASLGTAIPAFERRLPRLVAGPASFLPLWAASAILYPSEPQFLGRWTFALVMLPLYLAGGAVAGRATRRLEARPAGDGETDLTRRSLLRSAWVAAAGIALGATSLGNLVRRRPDPGLERLRGVSATPPSPAVATGDERFPRVPGLSPELTSNDHFYVVNEELYTPDIDPNAWSLSVTGLVDHPLQLTYEELKSFPVVERYQTLECISNTVGGPYISTALWTGVPVAAILDRAGVRPGAVEVAFVGGGYSDSMDVARALDQTTLIAIGMNGFVLPRAHGFPARVLGVGTYGMKNPKWLTGIEVVDRPYEGFWERRGWSKTTPVKTTSRIDTPADGATVGGEVPIAGVAFAGDRGISRVEVSTDGGSSWTAAVLKRALSPYTWRLWLYRWTPPAAGTYRIIVRATDGTGAVQASAAASSFPSGASGDHGISVTVG